MTVAISTMTPELRLELPNCPTPILNAAMFRVIRTFFWESEAWKYTADNGKNWVLNTLAVPALTAGTDIPAKCVVKRTDTITYNADGTGEWDTVIPFKTRDELDRERPKWRSDTGSNPVSWTNDNDGETIIVPMTTATVTTSLLLRVIIAPVFTLVTDTLPDKLYYEFEEIFKAGVLATLMKQPGKDWSDPKSATIYAHVFDAGAKKAKSRAEADYGQPKGTMAYGGI